MDKTLTGRIQRLIPKVTIEYLWSIRAHKAVYLGYHRKMRVEVQRVISRIRGATEPKVQYSSMLTRMKLYLYQTQTTMSSISEKKTLEVLNRIRCRHALE